MAKGSKCDPHEICEECPEWIFTLADLIMCMMGLFVVMWVLKQDNPPGGQAASAAAADAAQKTKMEELDPKKLREFREGFTGQVESLGMDPREMSYDLERLRMGRAGDGNQGTAAVDTEGAKGNDSEVLTIRLGPESAVGGPIAFDVGSAELSLSTKTRIDQLATAVRGHRQVIVIKGHASLDDLDEHATPQQRLDLSIRRAQAVADALVAAGVSPDVVRVLGCSTFEPVRQRAYTPGSHAANRRVEVEVTSTLVDQLQDPAPAAPEPAAPHEAPHGH